MKGWPVAVAVVAVAVASGVGLWVTWDSTRTAAIRTSQVPDDLIPTTTFSISGVTTTTVLPPCEPGGDVEPVQGDPAADWDRVVIDPGRGLSEDFAPDDLVSVSLAGFPSEDQVRSLVIDDLAALRADAEAAAAPLVIVSGYRSYSYQEDLFQNRVEQVGEEEAARHTARPGHSEHQLGTAIDVLEPGVGELTADFAATPAGRWLAEHAHEYGFVISYPDGATAVTCYEFEPWHLRYVGRENAAAVVDSGVPLREWLFDRAAADDSSG